MKTGGDRAAWRDGPSTAFIQGRVPIELGWQEIALRLGLAALASACIGLNRDERGRPAGLRTTMLVCLAAALAMIQVNLLLNLRGKTGDSFNVLDLMRLPLGILSGIGFIGAGTILKRGDTALGVTTAATLWYITVLGLLFGGGQLGVGVAATVMGLAILILLRLAESRMRRVRRGELELSFSASTTLDELDLRERLRGQGFGLRGWTVAYGPDSRLASITCSLEWKAPDAAEPELPTAIADLRSTPGIALLRWRES